MLIGDIVSSGQTLIETLGHLRQAGLPLAVCVAVHGIFAGEAYGQFRAAGAARIVTTNTVRHESNAIDVVPLLVQVLRSLVW